MPRIQLPQAPSWLHSGVAPAHRGIGVQGPREWRLGTLRIQPANRDILLGRVRALAGSS